MLWQQQGKARDGDGFVCDEKTVVLGFEKTVLRLFRQRKNQAGVKNFIQDSDLFLKIIFLCPIGAMNLMCVME
ncbi:hypothetical protein HMPREF9371_1070 [Neisseria shayeganii 871]|uniref:Uncharacterized protein n=1 Tax=Neisseria shayeganii 871 TaxID=1032488 RepID=G4CHI1_9NEIS|nr:hypothetical protein HMPREF9371_1070 [Neisseria shayeganii 871]